MLSLHKHGACCAGWRAASLGACTAPGPLDGTLLIGKWAVKLFSFVFKFIHFQCSLGVYSVKHYKGVKQWKDNLVQVKS